MRARPRTRRRALRPFVVLALALVLVATLVALRGQVLTVAARYLITAEEPAASDVVVALGGGRGQRTGEAVRLYQQGLAGRVILTGGRIPIAGPTVTYAELMAAQVHGLVPDSLLVLEERSTSTFEDAVFVLEDLEGLGASSAMIVTDPYHLRRTRATLRHVFQHSGIRLTFVMPGDSWFRVDKWWTHEGRLLAVTEEYLKMGYYVLAHGIWSWS